MHQKGEETILVTGNQNVWYRGSKLSHDHALPRLIGSLAKDVKNIFTPSHLPGDDDYPSR